MINKNILIKPFAESDIPKAVILEKLCFSDPWSYEAFSGAIKSGLFFGLAAYDSETLVGYITSYILLDTCDIANIAVLPEARRNGIAQLLLSSLLTHCHNNNVSIVNLEVRVSNNPAIALYRSNGFTPVGRRKGYYENPSEDAVLYSLFL